MNNVNISFPNMPYDVIYIIYRAKHSSAKHAHAKHILCETCHEPGRIKMTTH